MAGQPRENFPLFSSGKREKVADMIYGAGRKFLAQLKSMIVYGAVFYVIIVWDNQIWRWNADFEGIFTLRCRRPAASKRELLEVPP